MTGLRMDNVLLVVDDLEAVKAFFTELGLELEGETTVEGQSVDRLIGLDGVRATIASMRTPDGHGRIELDKFHTPAAIRAEPEDAPVNALGIRRIMFAVDDIEERPRPPARPRRRARRRSGAVRGQVPALLRPRPRGHHRRDWPSDSLKTRLAESEAPGLVPHGVDAQSGLLSRGPRTQILREDAGDRIVIRCGGGTQLAVTASTIGTADTQTQMAWRVPDIHAALAELKARGVTIEEYQSPDPMTVDGIADMGHSWAAWFFDPSRNVLAVVQPKG